MTPTQRLAEVLLGEPVNQWISRERANGASWRVVSRRLWQATDGAIDVTHETIRGWTQDAA